MHIINFVIVCKLIFNMFIISCFIGFTQQYPPGFYDLPQVPSFPENTPVSKYCFLLHPLWIVLFTASDYLFVIIKHFSYYNILPLLLYCFYFHLPTKRTSTIQHERCCKWHKTVVCLIICYCR